jgi:hypothetical protein
MRKQEGGFEEMTLKYSECGHETSGIIILNSNPLSIAAYMNWIDEGYLNKQGICFSCYLEKGVLKKQ